MNTPESQTRLTEQLIYETRQTVAWGQKVHRRFQEVTAELRAFRRKAFDDAPRAGNVAKRKKFGSGKGLAGISKDLLRRQETQHGGGEHEHTKPPRKMGDGWAEQIFFKEFSRLPPSPGIA
jgi:hypothetical protein